MENNYQASGELFEFGFDEQSKLTLRAIGKWAKITAVVAFISYGLTLIASFIVPSTVDSGTRAMMQAANTGGIVLNIVAVIIGVIINVFLFRFAQEIVEAVNITSQPKLESAFNNLKTYFQIIGIILVIFVVFFVLALVFGLLFNIANR